MTVRGELHELIDQLPESELPAVRGYLRYLAATTRDRVSKALLNAPVDDEPETEEERAAVRDAKEALAEGRVMSDEEMARQLGL